MNGCKTTLVCRNCQTNNGKKRFIDGKSWKKKIPIFFIFGGATGKLFRPIQIPNILT